MTVFFQKGNIIFADSDDILHKDRIKFSLSKIQKYDFVVIGDSVVADANIPDEYLFSNNLNTVKNFINLIHALMRLLKELIQQITPFYRIICNCLIIDRSHRL